MRCRVPAIGWILLLLFSCSTPIWPQAQPSQDVDDGKKAADKKVLRAGANVTPPRNIFHPDPEYSEEARKAGYRGTCVLRLIVGTDGVPTDIRVTRPLGMGLDEKAVEAVRQWKFTPAMKNGVPVGFQLNLEISFHLYDGLDNEFEKANAGDARAQFEFSQALLSRPGQLNIGSFGFTYLDKSARQGLPEAQFAMGEYLSSHGNDLVSAYVWYSLAERNHYKHSDKKMKELAKKMTPDTLAEAQRRANSDQPIDEEKPHTP